MYDRVGIVYPRRKGSNRGGPDFDCQQDRAERIRRAVHDKLRPERAAGLRGAPETQAALLEPVASDKPRQAESVFKKAEAYLADCYLTDACIRHEPRKLATIALAMAEIKLGADLQSGFRADLSDPRDGLLVCPEPPGKACFSDWMPKAKSKPQTPDKSSKSPQILAKRPPAVLKLEPLSPVSKLLPKSPLSPSLSPLKRRRSETASHTTHLLSFPWFEMTGENITMECLKFESKRVLSFIDENPESFVDPSN